MSQPEQFRIRDYQVEKALARGGMATVYLATDLRNGRKVALKQILPHIAEDREFIDRFRHEVQIHSQLEHPNILRLFEFGDGPTEYFITMEYVDGGTLKFLLDRLRRFPTEIALFVTREVLSGLAAAHARGIIHRDIKPHNIMITRSGEVKVGDFGISKTDQMTRLTQTGELIGTPAYMSPEQASGHALDPRSDIFSTGVMLYEMLAGTNPFFTGNPATTIRKIVDFDPEGLFEVDPTIPIECEALVNRLIAKNPAQRFANAETAVAAVDARLGALRIEDPQKIFRQFLETPKQYVEERNARLAKAHLERGKKLLESGKASAEVALWELFQAKRVQGENAEAAELMATITSKTGYRVEEPAAENAKVRALEEKLKDDPENIQVLLQLAKIHKLEKDFVNMMRFFLKLKSMEVEDAYLQNQIAALVAAPGAQPSSSPAAPGAPRAAAATRSPSTPPATAPPKLSEIGLPKPILIGGIVALVLVVLGIRSAFRDTEKMVPAPAATASATTPEGVDRATVRGDAGAVLTNARNLAATGDKNAAIDLLEGWIAKNPGHPETDSILMELGGDYDKVNRADKAISTWESIVSKGGPRALEARASRGDLLMRLGRDGEAEEDFRALVDSKDPRWIPLGRWNLGRIAEGRNDYGRALEQFQPLVNDFPGHDLAVEARLEIARIRLAGGNFDQAALYAGEAQKKAQPGGDVDRRAKELLKEIEAKRSGPAPSAAPAAPPVSAAAAPTE